MLWAAWLALAMVTEQGCFEAGATGGYAQSSSSGTITSKSATASVGVSPTGAPTAAVSSSHIDTTGFVANQSESQALTEYLKQRRLPLVGAQVLQGPDGERAVVLYGYVGSDFGKSDAAVKAGKYLNDSNVAIDNRIKVKPELLSSGSSSTSVSPSSSAPTTSTADNGSYPGADAYVEQQNEAQQYVQQQQTGAAMTTMTPLLMLGLMALSAASGGTFAVGPGNFGGGFGGGSFGPPPNPYSGFPSPGYPSSGYPPPGYSSFGP